MKALVFRHSLAREAAATIGGRLSRRAYVSRLAPTRLEDVAELPLPATSRALGELASAHLISQTAPGRFALHDLLREYATERAQAAGTPASRRAAIGRMLDHYLTTALAAVTLLDPRQLPDTTAAVTRAGVTPGHFADRRAAAHWFETEHQALMDQARADFAEVTRNLAAAYPESDKKIGATLNSFRASMLGRVEPFLLLLLGAVGFVLLIACVNIANLLLVRSSGRAREFAVRAALGAGKARIIRQLLTESILLAVVGAALGVLLANWGTRAALGALPAALPRAAESSCALPKKIPTQGGLKHIS